MTTLAHLPNFLPGGCRSLLQIGLGLALQSTLVLLAGLLAGQRLRRRGPAAAVMAYRATVVAALLGTLLALTIGGRFQPGWAIALPPAQGPVETVPAPGTAAARGTPALPVPRFVPAGGPGLGLIPTRHEAPNTPAVKRSTGFSPGDSAAPKPPDAPTPYRSPLPLGTTPIGWLCVLLVGLWARGGRAAGRPGPLLLDDGRLRRGERPAADDARGAPTASGAQVGGVRPPRFE